MARGPVRVNTYDQRTTPRSQAQPFTRSVDVGDGLARGLNKVGQALQAEVTFKRQQEEDDARVYASTAMSQARASASEMQRRIFSEAPDGWRGATQRFSQEFGQRREQALAGAPTPAAQRYLNQQFDAYQPLLLEEMAGQEQTNRETWQFSTIANNIDSDSNTIATNPGFYQPALTQQLDLINGMAMSEVNRERLRSHAISSYSTVAVSAMIERDPAGTLAALRGHSGGLGDVETLGPQIAAALGVRQTSGRRDPTRNAQVGGVSNSMHLDGMAADIEVPASYQGMSREEIEQATRARLGEAMPGAAFSEVIYEGDHIHIGWRPEGGAANANAEPVVDDPNGPIARLTGPERLALANQAAAAVNRQDTAWRTAVREQRETAEALYAAGEQPANPPTYETVLAAEGERAAAAYALQSQVFAASSSMQALPTNRLEQIASRPPMRDGTNEERFSNAVNRQAAQAILQQRAEDPMAYLGNHGRSIDTEGMMTDLQNADWQGIRGRLRSRQAVANQAHTDLGLTPNPLTATETRVFRASLDGMTAEQRVAAVSQMREALPDSNAYRALAGSLYPDSVASQLAMQVQGRRANFEGMPDITTEVAQRRLFDGAAALGMVQQQNTGTEQGADRPRVSFAMPSEAQMRQHWTSAVGDAYAGMAGTDAAAYEVFRTAYAGGAIAEGNNSGRYDASLANEAVAIATGGIARQGDHRMILPWGVNEASFNRSIQQGWRTNIQPRIQPDLANRSPSTFRYQSMGNGLYAIMTPQGAQVSSREGQPLYVRIPTGPAAIQQEAPPMEGIAQYRPGAEWPTQPGRHFRDRR